MISAGEIIADGTPDELKRKVGGEWLEVAVTVPDTTESAVAALRPVTAEGPSVDVQPLTITYRP
ncbi:hypothetical protein [Saccharopolyspora sp. NPDC002376]